MNIITKTSNILYTGGIIETDLRGIDKPSKSFTTRLVVGYYINFDLEVAVCGSTKQLIGFKIDDILNCANLIEFTLIIGDISRGLLGMFLNNEIFRFIIRSDFKSITYEPHYKNNYERGLKNGDCVIWSGDFIHCDSECVVRLLNFLKNNNIKITDFTDRPLSYN
jgi:hypothetical protein